MIQSILLMIFVVILGWVSDLTPRFIATPLSKLGMKIMYGLCFEGPSGIDEGIEDYIMNNGVRYSAPSINMLKKSKSDSRNEHVAQYFVEFSKFTDEQIHELQKYATTQSNPETKAIILKAISIANNKP